MQAVTGNKEFNNYGLRYKLREVQYHPEVMLQSLASAQIQATTRQCITGIHHVQRHVVTGAATQGNSRVETTGGE